MDLDDLEFLGGDVDAARLAARLDALRPELCTWSAQVIAARHPELLRFRGVKGRRAWEQDYDFVVRRLHAAVSEDMDGLGAATPWLTRPLAERGIDQHATEIAIAVAQEALLRMAGAQDGARLAARLAVVGAPSNQGRMSPWLSA